MHTPKGESMNHQPFEEWLLNDMPLDPDRKRELDLHIRSCAYCAALAETGMALHSVKMVSPANGFTARFQTRLGSTKTGRTPAKILGSAPVCVHGSCVALVAFGALCGFVRCFTCNMDHVLCGMGSISYYHVECYVPGWLCFITYCPGISFSLCMDDRGFGSCRAGSFVVSINLAVCSFAARSLVYEK